MNRPFRVAYLVSHPIQYQAPLLRHLARCAGIDLTVFFLSDYSTRQFFDPGFGSHMQWDVPLLEGYRHQFLPGIGGKKRISFWRPFVYGISRYFKERTFDALWIHGYAHQANLRALAIAKQLGTKVLLRGESHLSSHQRSVSKEWLRRRVLPKIFNAVDGFLAIGTLNHEYYSYYGVPQEKIFSMPYAVDNAFFQKEIEKCRPHRETFRKELDLKPGCPVILFASKFQTRKRPLDLLDAYSHLPLPRSQIEPDPYLLFVGEGEEGPKLNEAIKRRGSSKVKVIGFQNQTQLPRFYDLCDVFVLPSEHEPWGLVVNEVMNAGKSVIVSDKVGAGADLVANGQNGFVFPAGDVPALAQCLAKVTGSTELAQRMGRESSSRIAHWSFEQDYQGLLRALEFVV